MAGGVLLAIAFLDPGWGVLGWFAFLPLFALAPHAPSARGALGLGLAMGMTANGLVCFWLVQTIEHFGGFPLPLAIFFYAALVLYTGIPFAAVALGLHLGGPRAPILLAPALWVSAEFLFPNLFPWRLAYTQRDFLWLIQSADFAGPYLLSFVIAWTAAAATRLRVRALFAPAAAIMVLLAYGSVQVAEIDAGMRTAPQLRVGLVQGNISLEEKHGAGTATSNVEHYRRLSRALSPPPDLLVWPETVVTWGLPRTGGLSLERDPFPEAPAPLLFGALSYSTDSANPKWFNSLFLRTPAGSLEGPYDKMVLMPFGEFLPFSDLFPQIRALSPNTADFLPGSTAEVLDVGSHARIGPAICYEDMLREPLGTSARNGANLLISVANDGWYGGGSALLLHESLGMWRAIENRRFFVRVTNTGLTSVIDAAGRRILALPQDQARAQNVRVSLLDRPTFYQEHPDFFAQAVLVLALLLLVWSCRQNHRSSESSPA